MAAAAATAAAAAAAAATNQTMVEQLAAKPLELTGRGWATVGEACTCKSAPLGFQASNSEQKRFSVLKVPFVFTSS